jgi:hypothetical protein
VAWRCLVPEIADYVYEEWTIHPTLQLATSHHTEKTRPSRVGDTPEYTTASRDAYDSCRMVLGAVHRRARQSGELTSGKETKEIKTDVREKRDVTFTWRWSDTTIQP